MYWEQDNTGNSTRDGTGTPQTIWNSIHNNHSKKMKSVYFKIHYTKLHILGRFNSRCQLNRKA